MKIVIILLACVVSGFSAQAQQRAAISIGGSTLGATLEAGYRLGPNFGLRGIAGFGKADFTSNFNDAPVTGIANIGGVGILADIYLGGGGRISAGGLAPNFGAELAISGDITVDGASFSNVDISGNLDSVNRFAPMVAIGYERIFGNNWGVSADLGAIYTGGFFLSAIDNSGQISAEDLASELAATNAELERITVLPFVKLSVSFAF